MCSEVEQEGELNSFVGEILSSVPIKGRLRGKGDEEYRWGE